MISLTRNLRKLTFSKISELACKNNNIAMKSIINSHSFSYSVPPPHPDLEIPSNLKLADLSVLKEIKKITVPQDDYNFATIDIPKSIKVAIFNNPGSYSENTEPIDPRIFGVALRKDIVHEVVRYQRHKARQPKRTKRVGEIAGSTKKPYPQKGQGISQVGNRRNSSWRGGMKAHGPVIRDYAISLNRKYRAMGMMIVLAAKFREGNLLVFDNISTKTHRTKDLSEIFNKHGLSDLSTLVVDDELDEKFMMAVKNMAQVTPLLQTKANVYDIVKREKLVISKSALVSLQKRLIAQYTYTGKRKSLLANLNMIESAVKSKEDNEN